MKRFTDLHFFFYFSNSIWIYTFFFFFVETKSEKSRNETIRIQRRSISLHKSQTRGFVDLVCKSKKGEKEKTSQWHANTKYHCTLIPSFKSLLVLIVELFNNKKALIVETLNVHTYKQRNGKTSVKSSSSLLWLRMQRTQFSYAKTIAELIKMHLQAISKCLIERNYHLIRCLPLICHFLLVLELLWNT